MATTPATANTATDAPAEQPPPSPVPAPPNFPVTWAQPDDARHFWMFDRMHAPEPATPADGVSFWCAYDHGITMA
ncbi:MAG: hypothetical protein ACRDJN_26510, partial [Chloroflexota bacterium]